MLAGSRRAARCWYFARACAIVGEGEVVPRCARQAAGVQKSAAVVWLYDAMLRCGERLRVATSPLLRQRAPIAANAYLPLISHALHPEGRAHAESAERFEGDKSGVVV